jgi:hypothetical protein
MTFNGAAALRLRRARSRVHERGECRQSDLADNAMTHEESVSVVYRLASLRHAEATRTPTKTPITRPMTRARSTMSKRKSRGAGG